MFSSLQFLSVPCTGNMRHSNLSRFMLDHPVFFFLGGLGLKSNSYVPVSTTSLFSSPAYTTTITQPTEAIQREKKFNMRMMDKCTCNRTKDERVPQTPLLHYFYKSENKSNRRIHVIDSDMLRLRGTYMHTVHCITET